jgi:hypothetical protein
LIIATVLLGSRRIRDVPYTGDRSVDGIGAFLSVVGMGGLVVGVLVWQEGGESVALLLTVGVAAMAALVYWLRRRKREGKAALLDPGLFASKPYRLGVFQIFLQQVALGGMLIALPIYLQLVWGYNALEAGVTLAPLSLTMFGVAILAGKRAGRRRASSIVRAGFVLLTASMVIVIPLVPTADSGWTLAIPLALAGAGLGLLASQLNNYALSPLSEERVGEAAGVTSATGSFGLSFGLAFAGAIMLATLSIAFTNMAEASNVLPPADQQRVADVLEDDAQVMSDAQLEQLLAGQPEDIQEEILSINTDARHLPSGCTGRHPPRRSHRSRQRIPHDAPTRTTAVDRLGGCSPRLNLRRGPGGLDCSPHARETQEVAVRFQRVFAAARFESWVTCGPDLGRGGRRRATSGCVDAVIPEVCRRA